MSDVYINWGIVDRPFSFCFGGLLGMFHQARARLPEKDILATILPQDQCVDFYFDDQVEKKEIIDTWEDFNSHEEQEIRELYGAMPRFENDEVFLPLQAADFWASWARKGYEDGQLADYVSGDFRKWKGRRRIPYLNITFSEDEIVSGIMPRIRDKLGWQHAIYDAHFHPKPQERPKARSASPILFRIRNLFRRNHL